MNKKVLFGSIVCVVVVLVITLIFINNKQEKPTDTEKDTIYHSNVDKVFDNPTMAELTGFSDYVFVGVVDEVIDSEYNEKTDMMPYTKYKVTVKDNYKGELEKNIILSKYGGYDKNNNLHLIKDGNNIEPLLEKGKTYLFFTSTQEDGSILVLSIDGAHLLTNDSINSSAIKTNNAVTDIQKSVDEEVPYERKRYKSTYEISK